MKQPTSKPTKTRPSAASRYKAARLLTVKLPETGDVIQIRRIDQADLFSLGSLPDVLVSDDAREAIRTKNQLKLAVLASENETYCERFQKMILLRCVIDPAFQIVDKPADQCSENEVPLCAIGYLDKEAICRAVAGLSPIGAEMEVGRTVAPFSEKHKVAGVA
jgi:hypothetical protein